MDMSGEQRIATGQAAVWAALNDLDVLKACIPGCESIAKVSDTEHRVVMSAAVGPVKARFSGTMHLLDAAPPNSYRMTFEGQGGVAGFAKGEAHVRLQPDGGATVMSYRVRAQVGGKLAQIGSRLIDAAAKKLADDFFAAFSRRVAPPEATRELPPRPAIPSWAWALAAIAAVAALYLATN